MSFFNKLFNKQLYDKNIDAITNVFNMYSFFGEEKHIFNQTIIEKYKNSNESNDILAVAISYLGEGASHRKDAISFFEKYLSNPTTQTYFSKWFIFSSLSTLYEQEYMYDQAIDCLNKAILADNNENPADYTRIGNILLKKDVNLAIKYYEDLKLSFIYERYKDIFDKEYKEMLLKKQKGYIYKPRKRN